MSVYKHNLTISQNQRLVDITAWVREDVKKSGTENGIVVIYCPHTTAGITINENCDPDVCTDFIYGYEKIFPTSDAKYRHSEGNSHSHMKSSAVGASSTLIVDNGKLLLGTWQAVYFCEFDGPRNRSFYVKVMEG